MCHNYKMLATRDEHAALTSLFHKGNRQVYGKGDFVIRPGEAPPGVFYVESGLVKSYDITKYGEENLLIIRRSGELLGMTWAVTGEDRHIIYEALSPTVAWLLPRRRFFNYLQNDPRSALPVVDMLTEMYRIHSERILNLEYRTVRERLISFLLTSARRFGEPAENGSINLNIPLRHQDIASSINSSRETTSREMAYLERQGLVLNHQLYITLKDPVRLRTYLEG